MRTIIAIACICGFTFGFGAAPSFAQGNAGVDQYTEHIPSASGEKPTKTTVPSGSSDRAAPSVLTPRQVEALEAKGEDGEAVVRLVDATGLERPKPAETDAPGAGGRSGIAGIVSALAGGDGSGLGFALPVLLIATALGAVAYAAVRRARSGSER
jgi:hypothetical protein